MVRFERWLWSVARRGRNDALERADAFTRAMVDRRYGEAVDAAALVLAHGDVSHGRRVETTTVWRRSARMDVSYQHTALQDVFTERITTFAQIQGATVPVTYPLELPNIETTGIGTSVSVPAGFGPLPHQKPGLVAGQTLHQRNPVMAFGSYTSAMDTVVADHPTVTPIWVTVPLRRDGNLQRTTFNQALRGEVHNRGGILLDIADILSHTSDGQLVHARDGAPTIAPEWLDSEGDLTEAAGDRLADAWVVTLARAHATRTTGVVLRHAINLFSVEQAVD